MQAVAYFLSVYDDRGVILFFIVLLYQLEIQYSYSYSYS